MPSLAGDTPYVGKFKPTSKYLCIYISTPVDVDRQTDSDDITIVLLKARDGNNATTEYCAWPRSVSQLQSCGSLGFSNQLIHLGTIRRLFKFCYRTVCFSRVTEKTGKEVGICLRINDNLIGTLFRTDLLDKGPIMAENSKNTSAIHSLARYQTWRPEQMEEKHIFCSQKEKNLNPSKDIETYTIGLVYRLNFVFHGSRDFLEAKG